MEIKVWSATDSSSRPSSHLSSSFSSGTDSLHSLLDLWESRNLTRGALRNYTGDIEFGQFFISPAASAALSQGRSSPASRCTFSFCPSAKVLPIVPLFPKSPRVVRTLQAEKLVGRTSSWIVRKSAALIRLRKLDGKPSQLTCQRVGRTRQAEQPGSKCSHLHQVGEKFLNSEVASEVPALLTTRRICGTGGIRGGVQRTSSARSRRPSTTITPLGSVPRTDGNVGLRGLWFSWRCVRRQVEYEGHIFFQSSLFPFRVCKIGEQSSSRRSCPRGCAEQV